LHRAQPPVCANIIAQRLSATQQYWRLLYCLPPAFCYYVATIKNTKDPKMPTPKIAPNVVNVDALDLDDLRKLSEENSGYSLYAKMAVKAREARLAGDIRRARLCEELLEKYYGDLPSRLRW
jgi:hypothetical protein